MRNNQTTISQISNEYDVDIMVDNGGAVVFYRNTHDSDVIPFDEEINLKYFLENFEMVADLSKLQMNLYALND